MAAVTALDEIANAQAQISAGTTPQVPPGETSATPGAGAIVDPDELAHARAQLAAPSAPAAPAPASALPAGPTSIGPAPDRHWYSPINDAVDMIVRGMPFSDRVTAGLETATGTGLPNADYSKNLLNERLKNEALATQYPNLAPILGAAGGTAAILATAPEQVLAAPTIGARTAAGALTGGGYGALQGASATPDLTNAPQAAKDIGTGAVGGLAAGAAAPILAQGIGSAYTGAANALNGGVEGVSRRAAGPLLSAMSADTPAAVQANLARLGPKAMLVDAGPAMLGKAQGAALNSDEARNVVGTALAGRDAGTNARLAQDVNAAVGAPQSPLQASQSVQAQRDKIHQWLPAVFANAPDVDTTNVLATVAQGLPKAVGPEASVLGQARNWLMKNGPPDAEGNPTRVPVTDAETLQNVKMAVDKLIDYGDPSLGVQPGAVAKAQGSIGAVRAQLNQALRDQVPGYSSIMDASSALAKKMEGIEDGNAILGSGQSALSPEDLKARLAALPANWQQPYLDGLRIGSRGAIDRAMGTKANDLVALRNQMQGEGGWNEAKLADIHGAGPVGDIANSIDQNTAFRNTYQNVAQNSQTAQRQAAAAAMKPEAATGGIPLINPNMSPTGFLASGFKKLGGMALDQFRSDPTRAYGEIGRVLTAQGAPRDAYTQALADALMRRGANAAAGNAFGNRSAIAAALIGGRSLNDRLLAREGNSQP